MNIPDFPTLQEKARNGLRVALDEVQMVEVLRHVEDEAWTEIKRLHDQSSIPEAVWLEARRIEHEMSFAVYGDKMRGLRTWEMEDRRAILDRIRREDDRVLAFESLRLKSSIALEAWQKLLPKTFVTDSVGCTPCDYQLTKS